MKSVARSWCRSPARHRLAERGYRVLLVAERPPEADVEDPRGLVARPDCSGSRTASAPGRQTQCAAAARPG